MCKMDALVLCVLLALPVTGFADDILEFEMVGVVGPFVGSANPIRGIAGAGLPWTLNEAKGELSFDGFLEVEVRGLVLTVGPNAGTNPAMNVRAIVSCLTIDGGNIVVSNFTTGLFPATVDGDADIETFVVLPSPCTAPIVFVTVPVGHWIAATGH